MHAQKHWYPVKALPKGAFPKALPKGAFPKALPKGAFPKALPKGAFPKALPKGIRDLRPECIWKICNNLPIFRYNNILDRITIFSYNNYF